MTKSELAARIQGRLQNIPASNPSYVSVTPHTLRTLLDRDLLERIADDAADEALKCLAPRNAA